MICFAVVVVAPSMPVIVVGKHYTSNVMRYWIRILTHNLGLAFYTLGNGISSFALSSLVENDMIGTPFTTLSMVDTLGSLLAEPIVAKTFSWSMRLDGIWKGLPYIMSFLICVEAVLALFGADSAGLPVGADDNGERTSLLPGGTEEGQEYISDN